MRRRMKVAQLKELFDYETLKAKISELTKNGTDLMDLKYQSIDTSIMPMLLQRAVECKEQDGDYA
ncbi:hypothetical protein X777_05387 [Ooceraea biroi]|uniref:Uncharacterized protein n=1 Tax=Ooceraea biroi TaxID=2015173 RepID=A0A026WIF3_OOCBI|nr:hypothetical protein X777_05387 [Ooceraea biroi]